MVIRKVQALIVVSVCTYGVSLKIGLMCVVVNKGGKKKKINKNWRMKKFNLKKTEIKNKNK